MPGYSRLFLRNRTPAQKMDCTRAPDATQLVLDKPFCPAQSQIHEKGQAGPTLRDAVHCLSEYLAHTMRLFSRLFSIGKGDTPQNFIVQPFVGVGIVHFGMSRDEVRRAMPEPPKSFRKAQNSRHEADAFYRNAFQVFYGGDQPSVEYIELSRGSVVRAFYRDLDVFATPADEVVACVSCDSAFDETRREFPCSYIFRGLQLSLWRPVIPKFATDTEGNYFSTIGIGRKGYYDAV